MIRKVLRMSVPIILFVTVAASVSPARAQHSVARQWNDVLLEAIRNDFARPTVHARNLFHLAVALYDGWAVYDDVAQTYFLGRSVGGYACPFDGIDPPADVRAARETTMSYAAYRLLVHRFRNAPETEVEATMQRFEDLMIALGHDPGFTSTDYSGGSAAALGNHLGAQLIAFGHQDGANELGGYAYEYYEPVNPELDPVLPGNPDIVDPNRWQPLRLRRFIGQGGFPGVPSFLGPEWGAVTAFALSPLDADRHPRDGTEYVVYHDPGPPPLIDLEGEGSSSEAYAWGFSLVAIWSGHLDPTDGVMWDISPGALGNLPVDDLPTRPEDYPAFYDQLAGGDPSRGHAVNPHTGEPYEPQIVPRGDYTRVLAEFWADGPESETPPGHWFTILNYVMDHPEFERRFRGEGPELDTLEYDVKAYFALGGAMHDAAVTAWGIKGWYDYVRPVSAIRCMADLGQSSDPSLPNYHPAGLPLVEGAVEIVEAGDPLAGLDGEHVGKIKVKAWRGPFYILTPATDVAGVDWILIENWWPYQRPTFVSPPFAGYISGHSTFSRAAAEVLTLLTGDPYFPGGMGEFHAPANEFLVFEDGPSVDVTLQWATYRDASDQTSLSRIWGGIHPPADDIPGRHIGIEVGVDAFELAELYFLGGIETDVSTRLTRVFPNPLAANQVLTLAFDRPAGSGVELKVYDVRGRLLRDEFRALGGDERFLAFDPGDAPSGVYYVRLRGDTWSSSGRFVLVR